MVNERPTFESFANFREQPATLPIKEHDALSDAERDIFQGSYTSVIEVENANTVLKINRLLKYSPQEEEQVKYGAFEEPDFLAEKTKEQGPSGDAEDVNRENATEKMLDFAAYKRKAYDTLNKHIPQYLPELHGFAVVESPRKEVEKRLKKTRGRPLTPEQLAQIPEQEIALMEVWENVSAKDALEQIDFEALSTLQEDENFQQEIAGFANATLSLFRKEGTMLDICDFGGVRAHIKENRNLKIKRPKELIQILESPEEDVIIYPRNTVYKDGRVTFFDTYPLSNVEQFTEDKQLVKDVAVAIKEEQHDRLEELMGDQETREGLDKRQVAQYLILLKHMGADFSEVEG